MLSGRPPLERKSDRTKIKTAARHSCLLMLLTSKSGTNLGSNAKVKCEQGATQRYEIMLQ